MESLVINNGDFTIQNGWISGKDITINDGNFVFNNPMPIRADGKLTITGGIISVKGFEGTGDTVLRRNNNNISITGGNINGVSYSNE